MKRTIPLLILFAATAAPGLSQQVSTGPLTGRVEESTAPTAVDSRPLTSVNVEEHHACRLRRLGHGLAQAIRLTGRVTEQVLDNAIQAAAAGAANYYASVPTYNAYVSSYSAATSAVTSGDTDSCYHGYTYATCPYGYNGNSYGTPYISGRDTTRLQSDYVGGYRFYNSASGSAGVARPDMMGGYQVSTMTGPHTYSLYTASHVAGRGFGRW